ncbi:MAG: LacI family DNA-binding transcriptional regulator [Bacteroidota bacterium]
MSITIKDIARLAGVSHTTVSRALNDSSLISETRKQEIIKLARENNYVPNMMARGLTSKRSYTVGIILNFLGNIFTRQIMEGVENIAETNNYVMIFGDSREDAKRELKYIKTFAERGVDGLIIYPVTTTSSARNVSVLKKMEIPYLMINHQPHGTKSDIVSCDHYQAGYTATSHLLSLNHNHIAIIGGSGISENSEIVQGYIAALNSNNIAFSPDYLKVFDGNYSDNDLTAKVTVELLSKNPEITALVSYTDEIIPGIAGGLEKMDKKVPEDISVVGHGNMKSITAPYFDLTSVKYNTNLVGEEAMKLLISKMESKTTVNQQITIPVEIYKGTSSRKI